MSRVDVLKRSRESFSVKFLEFTRVVSKQKTPAFFEGEDEKYYSIRINAIRPDIKWSGVNCKGKINVIDMRNRIKRHNTYNNYSCLFFVDSDFDDNEELKNHGDVYLTPCYSVENFYFTDAAFTRVLSAEFGLSDTCDEHECFERCVSRYREIKAQYLELIKGFNLLVKEIRLMEQAGESAGRLNINNLNIDKLIDVGLFNVTKIYDESLPRSLFPELPEYMEVSLERSHDYFKDKDGELWYRGKQHAEFYRVFLMKLKSDRCKKDDRQIFCAKGNVKLQLTKANMISELSQYADTPDCLKGFLESFETDNQAA